MQNAMAAGAVPAYSPPAAAITYAPLRLEDLQQQLQQQQSIAAINAAAASGGMHFITPAAGQMTSAMTSDFQSPYAESLQSVSVGASVTDQQLVNYSSVSCKNRCTFHLNLNLIRMNFI